MAVLYIALLVTVLPATIAYFIGRFFPSEGFAFFACVFVGFMAWYAFPSFSWLDFIIIGVASFCGLAHRKPK
jgi:hypothetical protein